MKKLITLLFIATTLIGFGQAKEIDSLKLILIKKNSTEATVDILIGISKLFNRINPDSALVYFKKAINLSEKNKLKLETLRSYNGIATTYLIKGVLDSSHYYFNQSEKLLKIVKDYDATISYYGDRGALYYYQDDYKNSENNFKKALLLAKKNNKKDHILRHNNNLALAITQQGRNNEALEIYYESIRIAEEIDDFEHVGKLQNNIGLLYENMGQSEIALEFYEKALKIKEKKSSTVDIINGIYNVANMQLIIGTKNNDNQLIQNSEKNFNRLLSLAHEQNYGNAEMYGLEGLGLISKYKKDYNKAIEQFKLTAEKAIELKSNKYLAISYSNLGDISLLLNEVNVAENYLMRAEKIVNEIDVPRDKVLLFGNLVKLYSHKKQFEKAFSYLNLQRDLENQLSSKNLQNNISNYEVKYQTERKEKEIILQKEQLLKNKLEIKTKNTYALLMGSAVLVLSIILFGLYKRQQHKKREYSSQLQLKEAQTYSKLQDQRLRISRDLHDNIGSQLTFIISSIDNLKFLTDAGNEKLRNKLTEINQFASSTIAQLRDTIWAMNKNEISFEDFYSRTLAFVEKAKSVSTTIQFKVESTITSEIVFSSVKGINIFRVLQEAINNTIKYAEASEVGVLISENEKEFQFEIKDNGKGFDKNSVELGNGLENMQRRIQEIGGEITITSEIGEGTSIKISCSKNRSNAV